MGVQWFQVTVETVLETYGESTIESRRHTLEKVNETARRAVEDPEFNPYADEPQQPARENTPQEPVRKTQNETSASAADTPPTHIDAVINDTQEDRRYIANRPTAAGSTGQSKVIAREHALVSLLLTDENCMTGEG